jgi:hypothetical protein
MPIHEGIQYVWPEHLLRPPPPTRLVYLDLNHWIGLAQASTNHRTGAAYRDVLEACVAARSSGSVLFPLSLTHYIEVSNITDPAQRRALADVMERLSGFATLLPRDIIMKLELDAALTTRVGPASKPVADLPLTGFGVSWAFGRHVEWKFRSGEDDVTKQVRERWVGGVERFDEWHATFLLNAERACLAGPADDQVARLRSFGWRPEETVAITEQRAAQERAQAARLDVEPRWRRDRLRDVIATREIIVELMGAIEEALQLRNLSIDDVWRTRDDAREIVNCMPSVEVAVTLKTAAHRNQERKWTTNDIHDIDALSIAVPYCDVVVTEGHAHHMLHASGTPSRANTVVLRRLLELQPLL